MISTADLPETIPVFPLPGALLLPRARLPLHIFEPRYLAMIDDALKSSTRLIGMIQPCEGPKGCGCDPSRLQKIGCAGRLTGYSETEDGRYMVTLTGISRFRLTEEIDGFTPYRKVKPCWKGFERDLGKQEHDKGFDRARFMPQLCRYLEAQGLSTDWDSLEEAEDELLINSLSMLCPFDVEDKQALLEAPSLETRRETLVTLIEYALRSGGEEGEERMQ